MALDSLLELIDRNAPPQVDEEGRLSHGVGVDVRVVQSWEDEFPLQIDDLYLVMDGFRRRAKSQLSDCGTHHPQPAGVLRTLTLVESTCSGE